MTAFFQFLDRAFDLCLYLFRGWEPIVGLTVISVVVGFLMMMVFRHVSNQQAMKKVRDRIKAHFLEVRLFPDQLGVVLGAYGRIVYWTFAYFGYVLKPLAIMFLPISLLLVQMDLHFGYRPLVPEETFLVRARAERSADLDAISIRVPPGLVVTAPALHIPEEHEVDWRLSARRYGKWDLGVVVAGKPYSKQVVVSQELARVSTERVRPGWWEEFLHPGELPLPESAPLRSIGVNYPSRSIDVGWIGMDWIWYFLLVSIGSGLIIKVLFGIQI